MNNRKQKIDITVYHLSGPAMACDACLSKCSHRNSECPDPSEDTVRLKNLLNKAFPGKVSVEYIDLHQTPERGKHEDMLINSRMYQSPLVKINDTIAFSGGIPIEEITEMVKKLLQ